MEFFYISFNFKEVLKGVAVYDSILQLNRTEQRVESVYCLGDLTEITDQYRYRGENKTPVGNS